MKFSGKMCLVIILKVTKNQGFIICLEDTIFKKPQGVGGGRGGQIDPPSAVLGLSLPLLLNLHHLTVIPTRQYTPTLFSYQLFSDK